MCVESTAHAWVDVNSDDGVNIADVVFLLKYLFAGGDNPACLDAADVNDDGRLSIADAVKVLYYYFGETALLPEPFEECGIDVTVDQIDCESYSFCTTSEEDK